MKRILSLFTILILGSLLFSCSKREHVIMMSTTTSTDNSGLLDYLMPIFQKETEIRVKWVAVGTGAAIENGRLGEADILMVHDKPSELQYMEDGYGVSRSDLMYNDFVILGPNDIGTGTLESVLTTLSTEQLTFISRDDKSGTDVKEKYLWNLFSISHDGDWYVASGQGMSATLTMASEMQAYTISDRATYLTMKDQLDLHIVFENDPELYNQYGIILVNPDLNKNINYDDALVLYNWLISDHGQELISQFGMDTYGQSLFFPNAPKE